MTTYSSNTFSFSRLMLVMKRDLVENWKYNLQIALSMYGAFLISALMTYSSISDMSDINIYYSYRLGFYIAIGFITFCTLLLNAAHIMEVMNSKEKRIAYLMLPATQSEKYISRALQVVVGTVLMLFITLVFAEITRLLLFPLLGAPEVLQHFCIFDFGDVLSNTIFLSGVEDIELENIKNLAILSTCSWFLASLSFFILGGTYFYKKPAIKTFCLLILGFVAFSFILSNWEPHNNTVKEEIDYKISLILLIIISVTITVFNWGLSYFLFTRSQVTERINFKFLKRN